MKVLIISHNVFDNTTSMGKTLSSLFGQFNKNEIAQFYIHNEDPTLFNLCDNYFRITDSDIIKSIFFQFNKGKIINSQSSYNTEKTSFEKKAYSKGRTRTPFVYLLRNFIWSLGRWNNKKLNNWVDSFSPDFIFLACGDYSFLYKIAYKIAKKRGIPIIFYCVDDYYLYNKNSKKFLGSISYKLFMKTVLKTIAYCPSIVTICDKMAVEYSNFFKKKCTVIYTPAPAFTIPFAKKPFRLAYFGSLGLDRISPLIDIANILSKHPEFPIHKIDIYSSDNNNTSVLEKTKNNQYISFHSKVSEEGMHDILKECIGVIHVESFDRKILERTRFSISTKIPETLMFGPPLLAYGPAEIASIQYLENNNAAFVATNQKELDKTITRLMLSDDKNKIIDNARFLAKKNHDICKNSLTLRKLFQELNNKSHSNK